jgi:hypothetical protein
VFHFKCPSCDLERSENKVTAKYVEGHGICVAVFCEECEDLMELMNPKEGFPPHRDTTHW